MNRRDFMKGAGTCLLAFCLGPWKFVTSHEQRASGRESQLAEGSSTASGSDRTRWALVFDASKCIAGCDDCIASCHRAHNVPDIGGRREVKWLWKVDHDEAFPEQARSKTSGAPGFRYLVTCNHCDHPPCVKVCPTGATFKRADGIVMMDYHRCIGCRYCMAACPYGARSFNFVDPRPFISKVNPAYPTREKGVVEKCDLCVERLVVGAEPACVEACSHGALLYGDLNDPRSSVAMILKRQHALQRKPELGTGPGVYYIV